jgi:hypothetical protein
MTTNPYQPPETVKSRIERKKRPVNWKRICLTASGVELFWGAAIVMVHSTKPEWLWDTGVWYFVGGVGMVVAIIAAAIAFISAVGWSVNRDE